MADNTASLPESVIHKPFWKFSEIIELAIFKRFCSANCQDVGDEDRIQFKAELLSELREAILCGYVATVKLVKDETWKERNEPYLHYTRIWGIPAGIFVCYLALQHLLKTNPKLSPDIIKNGGNADFQRFFIDMGKYFFGYPALVMFVGWMLYLGYRMIIKYRNNSDQQKINHLMSDIQFRGYTTDLFDSETVIDFLNSRFSLKIEKDPFRVWKEPFFKRNGDFWIVGYMGKRICLKEKTGYEAMAFLLSRPNEEFRCTLFVKAHPEDSNNNTPIKEGSSSFDENDTIAQKIRSNKLDKNGVVSLLNIYIDGREDARSVGKTQDVVEYNEKIKELEQYIQETYTKSGEEKPPRDNATKARDAIKKAIDRCITELKKDHPFLAEHFAKTITRSYSLSYRPPEEIHWDIQI
jgi:ArsR family metal-binding transcriptional regulator